MAGGKRARLTVAVAVVTLLVPAQAGLAQDTPAPEPPPAATEPAPAPDDPPPPPPDDPPPATTEPTPPASTEPAAPPAEPPPPAEPTEPAAGGETTTTTASPPTESGSVELEDPPPPSTPPPTPPPTEPDPPASEPPPPPPEATVTLVPATPEPETVTVSVPAPATEPPVEAVEPEAPTADAVSPVSFAMRDPAEAIARLAAEASPPVRSPAPPRVDDEVPVAGVEQRCVRPRALVPLSDGCKQARAVAAVLGVSLSALPGPRVRAAIERATSNLVLRRFAARGPPADEAEAPRAADARPVSVLRDWGLGLSQGCHRSSVGSGTSSRVFVLPVPRLGAAPPFHFAERLLPVAVPKGALAVPPPPRPG